MLLKKLIEHGASAPYHRMLKQAKIKENESIMNSIILSEGKKAVDDVIHILEDNTDVSTDNDINENNLESKIMKKNSNVSSLQQLTTTDDEDADLEYFLETSVDLLNNTPLLW